MEESLGDIVIYNQIIFLIRFLIVGVAVGFITAWVRKFWGFDVTKSLDSIEKSARQYAESNGKEGNIWPLTLLLGGGLLVVAALASSIISGGV